MFDADCTITVSDFVGTFPAPAATGDGRLQSRSFPAGESGTVGEDLHPYLYRIDMTQVGALTAQICVRTMTIDFGPVEPLDYDGDGDPDHVWVVTGGGLGSLAPSTAVQTASPEICAG